VALSRGFCEATRSGIRLRSRTTVSEVRSIFFPIFVASSVPLLLGRRTQYLLCIGRLHSNLTMDVNSFRAMLFAVSKQLEA
jgi:hypothetical protein